MDENACLGGSLHWQKQLLGESLALAPKTIWAVPMARVHFRYADDRSVVVLDLNGDERVSDIKAKLNVRAVPRVV